MKKIYHICILLKKYVSNKVGSYTAIRNGVTLVLKGCKRVEFLDSVQFHETGNRNQMQCLKAMEVLSLPKQEVWI